MKKTLLSILVLLFVLMFALGLTSCVQPVEFKVNFLVDGEVYEIVTTNGKETVKMPEKPTKEGYTFDGWYWDNETWEKPFAANSLLDAPLSSDMNVYAKWTENNANPESSPNPDPNPDPNPNPNPNYNPAPHTHTAGTPIRENEVAASCKTAGSYDEVVKCSICNEEISRTERTIEKLTEHNYENGACSVCGVEAPPSVGLVYTKNSDNESYSVTGIGNCTDTDIVIPATYNNLSVTDIGSNAFEECYSLTSVTIPDSITSIGSNAFKNCSSLASVTIGNSVESVSYRAFYNCKSLKNITLPDSVTSVERAAFYNCISLTNVIIPNSVSSIGNSAFIYCINLTSVTLGSGVKRIDSSAFYGCIKLVEVINYSSLEINAGADANGDVAYYAKEVHDGKSKIVNKDDYLFYTYNGTNYLLGYEGEDNSLMLPLGYNGEEYEIYKYAFYDNSLITRATVPQEVTNIGYEAFASCNNLISVTIHDTIIGGNAFKECSKLVEVINKSLFDITKGSYEYGRIAEFAFEVHSGESKIVNKDGYLFYTYNGINYLLGYEGEGNSLILPLSYNGEKYEIYHSAFYDCNRLTSVTIPDGVERISGSAFYACDNLKSVTIPDSVMIIVGGAFYNCTSLTSIKYRGTETQWNAISKGNDWNYNTGSYTVTYNYTGE